MRNNELLRQAQANLDFFGVYLKHLNAEELDLEDVKRLEALIAMAGSISIDRVLQRQKRSITEDANR